MPLLRQGQELLRDEERSLRVGGCRHPLGHTDQRCRVKEVQSQHYPYGVCGWKVRGRMR